MKIEWRVLDGGRTIDHGDIDARNVLDAVMTLRKREGSPNSERGPNRELVLREQENGLLIARLEWESQKEAHE